MSSLDFDTKLTDSLERQLNAQAAEQERYASSSFFALLSSLLSPAYARTCDIVRSVAEGIRGARKHAARGEW